MFQTASLKSLYYAKHVSDALFNSNFIRNVSNFYTHTYPALFVSRKYIHLHLFVSLEYIHFHHFDIIIRRPKYYISNNVIYV